MGGGVKEDLGVEEYWGVVSVGVVGGDGGGVGESGLNSSLKGLVLSNSSIV